MGFDVYVFARIVIKPTRTVNLLAVVFLAAVYEILVDQGIVFFHLSSFICMV